MSKTQDIDNFMNIIVEEGLYSNKSNLQFNMDSLFEGIDFEAKNVLDIGGGSGVYSFYAACRGANRVVCLEPEDDGSTSGMTDEFNKTKSLLQYDNVELKPLTFQAFETNAEKFDIILLYNSINHLDEPACINLLKDSKSKDIYRDLFMKLYDLSNKGAKLIVCDCSNKNFFATIKAPNPVAGSIEWDKHQAPEVWADLLGEVGFVNPKIKWTSFNALRNFGKVLFGNKLMAYFLMSHFCLTMDTS